MYEAARDSRTDYLVGLYDVARGKLSTAERSMNRSVNSPSEALPIYYLWAGCLKEALGDEVGAVEEWRAGGAREYFMRKGYAYLVKAATMRNLCESTPLLFA